MKVGALPESTIITLLEPIQMFSTSIPQLEAISRKGFIKHKDDALAQQTFFSSHYNSLKKALKGIYYFIQLACTCLVCNKMNLIPPFSSFFKPQLARYLLDGCSSCLDDSRQGKLGNISSETYYFFASTLMSFCRWLELSAPTYEEFAESIMWKIIFQPRYFKAAIETLQRVAEDSDEKFLEGGDTVIQLASFLSSYAQLIDIEWNGKELQGSPYDPKVQNRILQSCKQVLQLAETSKNLDSDTKVHLRLVASCGASLAGVGAVQSAKKGPFPPDRDLNFPISMYITTNPTVLESVRLISESWTALAAAPWGPDIGTEDMSFLSIAPGKFFLTLNKLSTERCEYIFQDYTRSAHLKPFVPAFLKSIEYISTMISALAVFSERSITPTVAAYGLSGYVFAHHCYILASMYGMRLNADPPTQSEAETIRRHATAAARSASKLLRYLASAPLAIWQAACEAEEILALIRPGKFLKIGIDFAIGMPVILAKLPESHGSSRAMAAALLDLLHGLGSVPIETLKDIMQKNRLEEKAAPGAAMAGLLIKCNSNLEPVYTTSEISGLRATLEICKGEPDDCHAFLRGFTPSKMVEVMKELVKVVEKAPKPEELDTKNATARAMLLGSLPCSCLACKTLDPQPGKLCSGCRVVRYCNAQDQKADWKVHKVACKAFSSGKK